VTETIEYEQFDQGAASVAPLAADADLSRLNDIPMELGVEIGRTHMTVGETLQLRVGSVIELEREAGEPADLLVNGTAVARGEVVVIDERYGLRITEILDEQHDPSPPALGEEGEMIGDAAGAEDGAEPGAAEEG
jgi:flagellar motor switch protein FliN